MTKFEVCGPHAVFGVEPGGTVEVDDADVERLVDGGHIRKPKAKPKTRKGAS